MKTKSSEESWQSRAKLQGSAKAEQAFGDNGAKAKIDERSLGWTSEKVPPGLLGLWKIRSPRWKNELHEGSEELRKLTLERRKAEAEELRVCNTSRDGLEEEDGVRHP